MLRVISRKITRMKMPIKKFWMKKMMIKMKEKMILRKTMPNNYKARMH
jgi:hypothetical protein